jgi:hypothetical protein
LFTENAFFVDGVDTTDPVTSTFGTNFLFDAISEIEFQTAGYEAEFGRATGGVVNLITKSGGNQFSGTFDVRYQGDGFQDSGDHFDPDEQEFSFLQLGASLGGPILRDTLWFFAAYQLTDSDRTPTGAPETREFRGQYPLAKLTWQLSPSWRAVAKYSSDPVEIDYQNASPFVASEASAFQEQGGSIFGITVDGSLTDRLLWNASLGSFSSELNLYPQSGDLETVAVFDFGSQALTNNFDQQQYRESTRNEVTTDLTWFVDDLAGSHEFKFGLEYADMEWTKARCLTGTAGGVRCTEGVMGYRINSLGPIPFSMDTDLNPGMTSETGQLATAFVQDSWRIGRHVTAKIGVRYDTVSYDDEEGRQVADFEKWQPRLGLSWDITGDTKNVVRANYGQYMHPNSLQLPDFASPATTTSMSWASCSNNFFGVPAVGCEAVAGSLGWQWTADPLNFDPFGWFLPPFLIRGSEPNVIDPGLEPTSTDEFVLSYERALGRRSSIEVSYVNKQTNNIFDDTCEGNIPTPDPNASCATTVMANLSVLEREYQGFVLRYETRSLDWLTLLTSYTYSNSEGSIDESINSTTAFDLFPVHFENRYGYLNDHREHRFKLNGFVTLPGDWVISFAYYYESPFRWEPQALPPDSGGEFEGQPVPLIPFGVWYAEERGNREGDALQELDLQLAKGFRIGPTRLVLIGSVLNALSSENAVSVCGFIGGCGFDGDGNPIVLGDSTSWQIPRRYEVGVRLEF